ncbi:VPLPA-CTERM sorting domain-containing protein [Tropicimonas sp. S265A]|uniref:VPLPA-CTERM sorting domain-containing protein n=1 Tax=Tropicimonas sp. S265A TaxID=3415134 RepID=UPI003C7A5DAD
MRFVSLIAVLATGAIGTVAHADCTAVGGVPSGTTITCDGVSILDGPDATETRGIDDGSDNLTINVLSGAEIDTTASGDRAINLGNSEDSIVDNDGTINAGDEGIQGGDRLRVENSGTVTAVEKAIDANGDGVVVINSLGASITSVLNEGIETGDGATITNDGTVSAFDDAIQVGENALITNSGTIQNTQVAADIVGSVEAQDAIDIDSGTVVNTSTGKIISTTNAAIDFDPGANGSLIENAGVIKGTEAVTVDSADTAAQTVKNSGTLEGTSGTALNLGMGADAVELAESSIVIGDILLGAGLDTLTFTGMTYAGLAAGNTYAGGADDDTVVFDAYASGSIFDVVVAGVDVTLTLGTATDSLMLSLSSFETFVFSGGEADESFSLAELAAFGAPPVVPLPATGWLLLAGVGALSLRARRKAA